MIVLITVQEINEKTGIKELIVSHGLRGDLTTVILPPLHPRDLGAMIDPTLGEWVLYDRTELKK